MAISTGWISAFGAMTRALTRCREGENLNLGLEFLVFTLASGVSVASGLVGLGGGILMTPLLLYLPPALGLGSLDMKAVAGLTMVQGLFAAASGVLRHGRYGFVNIRLVSYMGSTAALSSLTGAIASQFVSTRTLEIVFACLALLASGLMFLPKRENEEQSYERHPILNRPLAIAMAAIIGFLGGLVGQGGAFILVPLMLYVLRLPTRVTLGSSLGIVFCAALAGFIGKLGTGQIDLFLALFLIAGAIPGAQLGGYLSKRTAAAHLRHLLAVFILMAAMKMWYEFLWP